MLSFYGELADVPAGGFAFATEFEKLCEVIVPQIGETKTLFPEFTPHDEKLHIANLFGLADKFFENSGYARLNVAELFLLAASLYAHDWGMAIGRDEKAYLASGADPSLLRDTFVPLPDERERLQAFARIEGLLSDDSKPFPPLSDDHLRSYVRQTHARRSGGRVRKHFEHAPGIGEALAHICEGHWHDFALLDDPERFHREYEAAGYTVNVLVLTLYLRLIDLFHITEDRTPYALWRFVSPHDKRSAAAWKKHRALHGVAIKAFPPGRSIKVQGFTEDEEVWAALEDLRRYCDAQVRRSHEIAVRHVHPRYAFDFIKLEWDVTTGSLRPVGLRFEFDRAAMFRILSDDIYEGDPYVFLRELLQNAIDAIRMRQARLAQVDRPRTKKKRSHDRFDSTIYFTAQHESNGDILITCRDNGIGMDEHVIRNYFSVAGISYYRSSEFQKQHLSFEPVSRFGVGILSCFMVSDTLRVRTYRDPLCGPPMAYVDTQSSVNDQHQARRLEIRIPAVDRQFVVTDAAASLQVGTELELTVSAKKLKQSPSISRRLKGSAPIQGDAGFNRILCITEFLADIAGFVEFPIHVRETWPGQNEPLLTLILHPDRDGNEVLQEYDGKLVLRHLTREYPWSLVTDPECVTAAQKQLTTETFELTDLLPQAGYEGWITFPTPKEKNWDFANVDRDAQVPSAEAKFQRYDRATFKAIGSPISWIAPQNYSELKERATNLFGVYRDGIKLPGLNKVAFTQSDAVLSLPALQVNLPSETSPPNLARTSLGPESENWDKAIQTALLKRLADTHIKDALALKSAERLFRLGWVGTVFRTAAQPLATIVPELTTPTLWLVSPGQLEIREDGFPRGHEVCIVPEEALDVVHARVLKRFCWTSLTLPDLQWQGPPSLLWQFQDQRTKPVLYGSQLATHWAAKRLVVSRLQFLQPPNAVAQLLRQNVCTSIEPTISAEIQKEIDASVDPRRALITHRRVRAALELARDDAPNLTAEDRDLLHKVFPFLPTRNPSALPVPFATPFSEYAATAQGDFNVLHRFGKSLCSALGALGIAEADGRFTAAELQKLHRDCMTHRFWLELSVTFDMEKFSARLFKIVVERQLMPGFQPPVAPKAEEYVPSFARNTDPRVFDLRKRYSPSVALGAFGGPVRNWL